MAAALEITARPTVLLLGQGTSIRVPEAFPSLSTSYYAHEDEEGGFVSPGFRPTPPRAKTAVTPAAWVEVDLRTEVKATAPPMTEADLLARNNELIQLYILLKAQQRALYSRLDILGHELVTSWSQETMKERAGVLSGGKPELERRTLEAFQQGRARKLEEQKVAWDELERIHGRFAEYERERNFIESLLRV